MRGLITGAYRVRGFQLTGGPAWLDSERFDIEARAPESAAPDMGAMVRALLADRFKLVVHIETKGDVVYGLVWARPDRRFGSQMKPSTVDCSTSRCGVNTTGGRITGTGTNIANLINALSNFGLNRTT